MQFQDSYLPFEEARRYIHSLKLESRNEWYQFIKNNQLPQYIPRKPDYTYKNKGWDGWGDWLGTGMIASFEREYLPFEQARNYVRTLQLRNVEEWKTYVKGTNFPKDVPKNPGSVYKDSGWSGFKDWLGTIDLIKTNNRFLPLDEARNFVQNLNLGSRAEWNKYIKREDFPQNIPKDPYNFYKNKGWKGWGNWLGTGTIAVSERKYWSFEKSKEYINALRLTTREAYRNFANSDNFPNELPKDPASYYKMHGWNGWGDWLGTGSIAKQNRSYLAFEQARNYVHSLGIKNQTEWNKLCSQMPENIPKAPSHVYKNSGWNGWGDWLGTGTVAVFNREYLSFELARNFVRELGLLSKTYWANYTKSKNFPKNIPKKPEHVYKGKGWNGWGDWLGTGTKAPIDREYLPFESARSYVHTLKLKSFTEWGELIQKKSFPSNIPKTPRHVYKDTGWTNMQDWLGCLGDGRHQWYKSSIVIFLESLKEELINLESIELITIINSNNLAKKLKDLGKLDELISTEPESDKRAQIIDDLTTYFKKELVNKDLDEESIEQEEFLEKSNLHTLFSEPLHKSEHFEGSDFNKTRDQTHLRKTQDDFNFLHVYDSKMMNASLDDENLDFLLKNQLKRLWNEVLNETKAIETLRKEEGGKNFTLLKQWFFDEYDQIMGLKNPDDYHFQDNNGVLLQPNTMQKLTAFRLLKEKFYGNWSGTGAGKTLSAIYAGRVANAKNTVIICNNATVKGWIESIHQYFKNSYVYIKKSFVDSDIPYSLYNVVNRYNIHLPDNQYNYLILNYETFQQAGAENIVVELLAKNRIDFVILDEVQSVKQRESGKESIRRNTINKLLIHAREQNPLMLCMVMSATPIINNLYEPKALIEMLTGLEHDDLQTTENIANGIEMYKALTRYGLRYTPLYEIELKQEIIPIDGSHLVNELIQINKGSVLEFEQVLLQSKIDAIKHLIKPGTLIYTYYVREMAEPIGEYIKKLGFKVGYYMGEDKSGLNAFKSKQIDVSIGSAPISTGVDGIQKVCDTLIPICLPWTSAEYKQLIGRIYRQGSVFEKIKVYIPQVTLELDTGQWSWDKKRYSIIQYKATLADLVIDGRIPQSLLPSKSKMVQDAQQELTDWIERIKHKDIITFEREKLTIPLNPSQLKYQKKKLGGFSELNHLWSIKHSKTTHEELNKNPEDWYYYHSLYREQRKTWSEIPYIEIAKRITRSNFIVADLGCGENLLKNEIPNKVLSFDHVAIDDSVTVCDISNVPLKDKYVDVAVLSLALMGSNSDTYIKEAYRILNNMGFIIIAEPIKKWEGQLDRLKQIICECGFTEPSIKETKQFIYLQSFKL